MAAAALLLLWEGRGLTLFVDEWTFGFGFRTGHDLSAFLAPDNGHLALVPVLITKASLQLFGASSRSPLTSASRSSSTCWRAGPSAAGRRWRRPC